MIKFTVGITGGSGVGKTTLIDLIKEEFGKDVTVFSLDNYYLSKEKQSRDENGIINFDLPTALDVASMESDLKRLLAGESIDQELYVFNNPNKDCEPLRLHPRAILLVEGIFVMHYEFIRELLDYSVYVSSPTHLQLNRRLKRDREERNYSDEDILYQWNNHVIPAYNTYLRPYKNQVDLVINNLEEFDENVATLLERIHRCGEMQTQ
ncbi:hypothetical protein JYT72_01715 [Crocinitomix catalasitica]|nr:hypothetical protein [Crocinitomix catalasitica]